MKALSRTIKTIQNSEAFIEMKKTAIIISVFLAVCCVISLAACTGKTSETNITTESTTEVKAIVNPLTGESGFDEALVGKRPLAIMVENHPDARPQWGLCTPDIVVEGLVEGGITRMMWIYSDVSKVEKIGPCRSARHDYIEVAMGFDAIYTHFGGSNVAYSRLSEDSTIDHIDGSKADGSYFSRDKSRNVASEHTAYTTGEWLTKAISSKSFRTDLNSSYVSPLAFASEKRSLSGGACASIKVSFSASYNHTFKYDSSDGLYYNYMNSNKMVDADGKQMAVSNVIVLYCGVSMFPNSNKLVEWDLSSGKGVYVSNGTIENITWKKGSTHDMLKLYSADGTELKLNTGKSWMGFVPQSRISNTVVSATEA